MFDHPSLQKILLSADSNMRHHLSGTPMTQLGGLDSKLLDIASGLKSKCTLLVGVHIRNADAIADEVRRDGAAQRPDQ